MKSIRAVAWRGDSCKDSQFGRTTGFTATSGGDGNKVAGGSQGQFQPLSYERGALFAAVGTLPPSSGAMLVWVPFPSGERVGVNTVELAATVLAEGAWVLGLRSSVLELGRMSRSPGEAPKPKTQDPRPKSYVLAVFRDCLRPDRRGRDPRRRPYGVIRAADGRLGEVRIRPFPKIASVPEATYLGGWRHRLWPATAFGCTTISRGGFATSSSCAYVVSNRDTSLATVRLALEALEEIARLKRSDALLCDAGNWRNSGKAARSPRLVAALPHPLASALYQAVYGQYPEPEGDRPATRPAAAISLP